MADQFPLYASVALETSLPKTLDYGIPEHLVSALQRGSRVVVPVRGRGRKGIVIAVKEKGEVAKCLPVSELIERDPFLNDDLLDLALWISQYYCTPLPRVLKMMLPSSVRHDIAPKRLKLVKRNKTCEELKELCASLRVKHPAQAAVLDVMLKVKKQVALSELLKEAKVTKSPVDTLVKGGWLSFEELSLTSNFEDYFPSKPKPLNEEQKEAYEAIVASLESSQFATHLLHGVTGSGKTEVYLQAIEKVLSQGRGALMLVPEVALTEQTIERFRSRFGFGIAILHHRLSHGERFEAWHRIKRGEARIAIGARSALFCPMPSLGLIIVDEEQEHSYKQTDEMPCYHARDVAVMRGKISHATVILGSATPSLESYSNALKGKYKLNILTKRPGSSKPPQITIVDMAREYEKRGGMVSFSDPLLDKIRLRQERGEQSILFLNRRGYHTSLFCPTCREALRCPHCAVSLTYHQSSHHLSCHLCGYALSPPPALCPICKQASPLKFRGAGTEMIEKALHAILPQIRTLRLDADTTRHKGSHQLLLRDFGHGKADVLIGTQMVAKGLHFPQVTLVGVLNCDFSLNIPDFRAQESLFQLIVQVAGRAGRGDVAGEVLLQTALPDNPILQIAASQDYAKFYAEETVSRELFNFPPFSKLAKLLFIGKQEKKTEEAAENFRAALCPRVSNQVTLHPVTPCGYAKIKDEYRFQFLVRAPSLQNIAKAIIETEITHPVPSSVKLRIDMDPLSTFF